MCMSLRASGCFGENDSQAGQRWSSIDHDPLTILSFPVTLGADGMISPVATIQPHGPHPMTPVDLRELPFSLIPEHRIR
jgi:hypothetical protein